MLEKPFHKKITTNQHLGIAKTAARVANKSYWPGIFRNLTRYVHSCSLCQQYKQLQQPPPGIMQSSKNANPWETISTDLVGPLPRSNKENIYLLEF